MAIRDLVSWARPSGGRNLAERDADEAPLLTLHREVNRLFDEVFRGFAASPSVPPAWPNIEIKRGDEGMTVKAEMPGISEKDVEIHVDDDLLTLRGERRSDEHDASKGYSEHFYGRFERSIPLPRGVDADKARASFKDGILTVSLPFTADADPGRRIPISGASR